MDRITVRVPASISNLGPGFDCLGMAVRLYNVVEVERVAKRADLPKILDEAANIFFRRSKTRPFRFNCSVTDHVPRARGLGSSATVRLGLMFGLNRLAGNVISRHLLFECCAELEDHPDNAAPACFGGFTVARSALVQRFDVSPRLKCVLLIPDHEVKTSDARRILPRQLLRTNAVESCGDACAITAAFVSGNYRALQGHFADRLHQPFRSKLVPYLARVIASAERAGALGAFLSGSGSTIAALTLKPPQQIAAAMLRAMGKRPARTIVVSADNHGAAITQHKT